MNFVEKVCNLQLMNLLTVNKHFSKNVEEQIWGCHIVKYLFDCLTT